MQILLVEDDPSIREILAEFLEEEGLTVSLAADAESGLCMATEHPPKVIVTDIDLGVGMDGIAFAEEATRRWPDTGIVYMTGRPASLGNRTLRPGDYFFTKPFSPRDLVSIVARRAVAGLVA